MATVSNSANTGFIKSEKRSNNPIKLMNKHEFEVRKEEIYLTDGI